MIKKIKYWLINRLDGNPDYCWANLVMWAEGYRSFWSLFKKSHDENDYKDLICTDYAYCNKCEVTGKIRQNIQETK